MPILTRAELARYPGQNATEQAANQHAEDLARPAQRAKSLGSLRASSARPTWDAAAIALPRVLDLRPFPGRDRTERVMAWLVAHTPRAASWSVDSLRELSERIAATGKLIE